LKEILKELGPPTRILNTPQKKRDKTLFALQTREKQVYPRKLKPKEPIRRLEEKPM